MERNGIRSPPCCAAVLLVNSQQHCPLGPQVTGFRSYVDLYVKDKLDETGVALKVVNESVSERWEVGLAMSEKGFQQVSFVNSIATTKVCYQWAHPLLSALLLTSNSTPPPDTTASHYRLNVLHVNVSILRSLCRHPDDKGCGAH